MNRFRAPRLAAVLAVTLLAAACAPAATPANAIDTTFGIRPVRFEDGLQRYLT